MSKYLKCMHIVAIVLLSTVLTTTYAKNIIIHKTNILNQVRHAHWFEQGNPNAPHQIYVIAEPNCMACHYLYQSIAPYIARGILKVRWIMVAFMKSSSFGKSAAIIIDKNPASAFNLNEVKFDQSNEEGGIAPLKLVPTAAQAIITSNNRFMRQHGFISTPIIIYKSSSGRTVTLKGAPQKTEWSELINYIGKYNG